MSVALAHTYGDGPCSACGDLDGCHVPGKVRRSREIARYGQAHPLVVCLCGSTRFYEAFQQANYEETMAGNIVLSVGFYAHCSTRAHGEAVGCTRAAKEALDELHLRKVEMADEVLVLNVGGYVGYSTSREVAHALALGKRVRYLEPGEKGGG